MDRKFFALLLSIVFLTPIIMFLLQGDGSLPETALEITGINATGMPEVLITVNVVDSLGQPVSGLTEENFRLSGDIAEVAEIVKVENITDDNLPFAAVLVIDTSTSMDGRPIQEAKAAASSFVNTIGDNASVAIITFNTQARLVQDYTTDKDLLLNTIWALPHGGETAIYDAGQLAVETAANSLFPRRTAIILSDGAEYGGNSSASRESALETAQVRGVPVYTIGLGYGVDRTYLQELSEGTNARNFESPTPNELTEIYTSLANLLRSQYVITLNMDVPLDGTEYDLDLQVVRPEGDLHEASAVVRAPIPVPIVEVNIPAKPIAEPLVLAPVVKGDDELDVVVYAIGLDQPITFESEPYAIAIDPLNFAPGTYNFMVSAADVDGDVGIFESSFEIAALPSDINIIPDLTNFEISESTDVLIETSGQTPATSVIVMIDETETPIEQGPPYVYTIDPLTLQPGEHTFVVEVVNEGGATTRTEQTFSVATLESTFTITGVEANTTFEDSFTLDDVVTVAVEIVGTQTDITEITYVINGETFATLTEAPYSLDLPLLELGTGQQTLEITVNNAGEVAASESVTFNIVVIPTPTPIPTATFTATVNIQATTNAGATAAAGTVNAISTHAQARAFLAATADAQSTQDSQATGEAELMATQDTVNAQSTTNVMVTQSARATQNAQVTAVAENVRATITSAGQTSTADAQATQDALNSQMTADARLATQTQGAVNLQATDNAQATQDALNSQMTADARLATQTQGAVNLQATDNAQATQDALNSQMTADARLATQTQEAVNLQATDNAQATQDALNSQMTADARLATQTQEAVNLQATDNAQATQDALNSQMTADARLATQTQEAVNLQATDNAQATQDALNSQMTADARLATQTQEAVNLQATDNAQATQDALNSQMTADARLATQTQEAVNLQATMTQIVIDIQGTEDAGTTITTEATQIAQAQATQDTKATLDIQATTNAQATQDGEPTETATEEESMATPTEPEPTRTPVGPLVEEQTDEGDSDSQDNLVLLIAAGVVAFLLALIVGLFTRRNRNN